MYQYKMVQIPPNIAIKSKARGNEAAAHLEEIINTQAQEGWEFYRVDTIGVKVEPGCLAGLFGQKEAVNTYYVITLRKQQTGNLPVQKSVGPPTVVKKSNIDKPEESYELEGV